MTTDKLENGLLDEYCRLLAPYKDREATFLEVGTWNGGYLEFLKHNFPSAKIHGADIVPIEIPGTHFHQVDQNKEYDLAELAEFGPFDMICEDGAHTASASKTTFLALWESVRPGGMYIIEDFVAGYCAG